MNPLQELARDRVKPRLESLGYIGRGMTFRFLREGGHQAVFDLNRIRRGRFDLEFGVGTGLLVRDWIEFVQGRPVVDFARADRGAGPIQGALEDPRADRTNPVKDWWFDVGDEAAVRRFLDTLAAEAERFAHLTAPDVFEAQVRADFPDLPWALTPTRSALLAVLLAGDGRVEEARELLDDSRDWVRYHDLVAWVDSKAG